VNHAAELEKTYRDAGCPIISVTEISPGRYEVVKPRIRQVITHSELVAEINRVWESVSRGA
jgi:hypothetical protein